MNTLSTKLKLLSVLVLLLFLGNGHLFGSPLQIANADAEGLRSQVSRNVDPRSDVRSRVLERVAEHFAKSRRARSDSASNSHADKPKQDSHNDSDNKPSKNKDADKEHDASGTKKHDDEHMNKDSDENGHSSSWNDGRTHHDDNTKSEDQDKKYDHAKHEDNADSDSSSDSDTQVSSDDNSENASSENEEKVNGSNDDGDRTDDSDDENMSNDEQENGNEDRDKPADETVHDSDETMTDETSDNDRDNETIQDDNDENTESDEGTDATRTPSNEEQSNGKTTSDPADEDSDNESQGLISIDFDDGWLSGYENGMPIINAAGFKTTQFIITSAPGDPAYMTWSQIEELARQGHEIGNHTVLHSHLNDLDDEDREQEISGAQDDFIAHGIDPTSFAYPYNDHDSDTIDFVRDSDLFSNARLSGDGINYGNIDPFELKAESLMSDMSFEHVRDNIDDAIENDGWYIIVVHSIDDSHDDYSITSDMLQDIVDYIKEKGVRVVTNAEGAKIFGK